MISFAPALDRIRKAAGRPYPDLEAGAAERWVASPATKRFIAPARFLPGQLDRIRGTAFAGAAEIVRDFRGGFEAMEDATLGFRVKDVDLVDGVLYARGAARHLRPRTRTRAAYVGVPEERSGALYESWLGNRWFANWLAEDCLTYRLAERFGTPVTTSVGPTGHAPQYEALLGMTPARVDRAHFSELVFFRDGSNNLGRTARARDFRERVVASRAFPGHPGVFLLRGATGDRRILRNERALAERLAEARGFRILDPSRASVAEIVEACAGARVVAGVEGSQLVHGLMLMPPGAALFVLQPPERVVGVLKLYADRQDQIYAFVIGAGGASEFTVDWDEVRATLDLVDG